MKKNRQYVNERQYITRCLGCSDFDIMTCGQPVYCRTCDPRPRYPGILYGTARWKRIRLEILKRDGNKCHYCGGKANSVDHVLPKKGGGDESPANLVACCASCNSKKAVFQ